MRDLKGIDFLKYDELRIHNMRKMGLQRGDRIADCPGATPHLPRRRLACHGAFAAWCQHAERAPCCRKHDRTGPRLSPQSGAALAVSHRNGNFPFRVSALSQMLATVESLTRDALCTHRHGRGHLVCHVSLKPLFGCVLCLHSWPMIV